MFYVRNCFAPSSRIVYQYRAYARGKTYFISEKRKRTQDVLVCSYVEVVKRDNIMRLGIMKRHLHIRYGALKKKNVFVFVYFPSVLNVLSKHVIWRGHTLNKYLDYCILVMKSTLILFFQRSSFDHIFSGVYWCATL